jgi:hypothetical protein
MPAQTTTRKVAYYSENDTAPPLRQRLLDGAGDPLVLTGATVEITISHARWDYYYSPTLNIVDEADVVIEDQGQFPGWVHWIPAIGDLSPPGGYLYSFKVIYPDLTEQTVPPNTYLPMIVRAPVGGSPGSKTAAP